VNTQTLSSPQLPPQPKELQISQAMHLGFNLWENMEKWQRQFGDAFTLKLPGQGPMVWVSNPEMVKDVFSLKPDQYDPSLVQIPMDIGEQNTVFLNNKEHEASRKIIIPPLNTNRLKERAGIMHEIVSEHINSWVPGDRYNVPRLVGDMTLDIICFTMFNLRHGPRKERYKKLMLGWLLTSCSDAMFAIGSLLGAKRVRNILNNQYVKRTASKDFGDGEKGLTPWKQPIELKVQLADMIRIDL